MEKIDVIVETPKGSPVKYHYDQFNDHFKLKKALPAGMVFPYDFGFIPGTRGEDGDPLDIILISEFCTFPGCRLECRIIGCIQAKQTDPKNKTRKIRNDRFLALPEPSILFAKIKTIKDLPDKLVSELEAFFIQYNKMEDKIFTIIGRRGPETSARLIEAARE